eukprot:COSAG02_NODE_2212_length_9491_cov_210.102215_8_plen_247_part_00
MALYSALNSFTPRLRAQGCVSGWVHNYQWGMPCDEVAGSSLQLGGDGCCVLTDEIEQQIPILLRYRVSLYWAVTTLTTIGYGDITPKSTLEQWTAMVAMAAGAFLFGMLLGTLSAQITAGNIADQEYDKQMETVREFLRAKKVNVEQRRKIMAFYDNYFHSKTVFAEEALLEKLPEQMRMDLMRQMYDELVSPFSSGSARTLRLRLLVCFCLCLKKLLTPNDCCVAPVLDWPVRVDKSCAILQHAK